MQNGNQSLSLWINSSKESILTSLHKWIRLFYGWKTHLEIGIGQKIEIVQKKKKEIGMGHKNCSDSANTQVRLLL